jgi:hypothetical protein
MFSSYTPSSYGLSAMTIKDYLTFIFELYKVEIDNLDENEKVELIKMLQEEYKNLLRKN